MKLDVFSRESENSSCLKKGKRPFQTMLEMLLRSRKRNKIFQIIIIKFIPGKR